MDDLLREFLTETSESLGVVDVELVRFEQDPNNAKILANIFRLVHTIKGTCGFLGLPRLEALAHAAETLMGKFRDGLPVTAGAVTLILSTIDRIKQLLDELEANQQETAGEDRDLIDQLEQMVRGEAVAQPAKEPQVATGSLTLQVLERQLRPGEVSLDDLERAFRETEIEVAPAPTPAEPSGQSKRAPAASTPAAAAAAAKKAAAAPEDERHDSKVANQSIRVNVETLEHLMTMVSELVLTRNQLLEIVRRHEDTEFKVPLQRLSNVTAELQEGVMKTRMQPIGNAWQKLPRIVRDLAAELSKEIELEMHGADTELDRQVLDLIKDPLTHMVRNSADHGLEIPGRASCARQAGQGRDQALRLSRGRPHHHRDRRRRPRPQYREDQSKGDLLRSRHRSRHRKDDRGADPQVHLSRRVLDRRQRDERVRPRRRHGCGAHQHRPDRRHDRRQVGAGRRVEFRHQDPADARHRLGTDRRGGRRPLCDTAALGRRAGARAKQ